MEFCPHCRAMQRARKTTRTHEEVRDDQPATIRVHSYHCARCGALLYKDEQVMPPAADAEAAVTAEEPEPAQQAEE